MPFTHVCVRLAKIDRIAVSETSQKIKDFRDTAGFQSQRFTIVVASVWTVVQPPR